MIADIYDAMAKGHDYTEIEKIFHASMPDYVASSAITATVNDSIKTLELAKRVKHDAVTILGGLHPTFMYEEVLNSSKALDYIVIGEGEETLRELLTVLEEDGDPATVDGLAFRRGDRIVTTPKRRFMESIDDLPAAWDLLDWPDYTYNFIPDSRLGAISTSRGCDHECCYCSQRKFRDKSWLARDPLKVVDELEYLYASFQVNVFLIADEHPTRDRERWENLLDLLITRGLPIYLLMETLPGDIIRDSDIIRKYRKAGVIYISLGIVAEGQGHPEKPGIDASVAATKKALDIIHEEGIVTEASFMLGFPDETSATIKSSLQLARHYNPDNANFFAVTPWPYSEMYPDFKQHIREWDYSRYNLVDPVIEPKTMSLLQMEVALAECYRKFYMGKITEVMTMKDDFKRRYMMRATKLFMSSPFILKKLGIGIFGKIPAKMEEMKKK